MDFIGISERKGNIRIIGSNIPQEIWREAIKNGRKDGTITNTMDDEQIVHYLFILKELLNK